MHYKNYIHRDLKTLNIFLTKDNITRVGDLGLSMKIEEKAHDKETTMTKTEIIKEKDQNNYGKQEEEKQNEMLQVAKLKLQEAEMKLEQKEDDGMLYDHFDQDQFLLELIDEEDYEVAGENRDTMLIERDTSILKTIKKSMSSKHESFNLYSEQAVGTPLYMAPEIWNDKNYSKAADVWAIGIILHEISTLKHPFTSHNKEELKRRICTEQLSKFKSS